MFLLFYTNCIPEFEIQNRIQIQKKNQRSIFYGNLIKPKTFLLISKLKSFVQQQPFRFCHEQSNPIYSWTDFNAFTNKEYFENVNLSFSSMP